MGNNALVVKSNDLIMGTLELEANGKKLLALLASKIKKDDSDFKRYYFTAKEIAEFLGVDINSKHIYADIDRLSTALMKTIVYIKDKEKQKFEKISVLCYSIYEKGVLGVEFSPKMMPFYLNLQGRFTKYELKQAADCKGKHGFTMFELMSMAKWEKELLISFEEFNRVLGTNYTRWDNLSAQILKPYQKILQECTSLSYEYEGRKINNSKKNDHIYFHIKDRAINQIESRSENNGTLILDPELISIYGSPEKIEKTIYELKQIVPGMKSEKAVLLDNAKFPGKYKIKSKAKITNFEERKYDIETLKDKLVKRGRKEN